MAYITINGLTVESAWVHLPRVGVWRAELVLAEEGFRSSAVAISVADGALQMHGTVRVGGDFEGKTRVEVVGGAGGLHTLVRPRGYQNTPLRIPLTQALQDAGERLSPAADAAMLGINLRHWMTRKEPASSVVEALVAQAGAAWRVLPDGYTWVGVETWPAVTFGFELLRPNALNDTVCGTFTTPNLLPGTRWGGRKVSSVTYRIDGKRQEAEVAFEP